MRTAGEVGAREGIARVRRVRPAPDQPRFRVSVALVAWIAAFFIGNVGSIVLLGALGHADDSDPSVRTACNLADLAGRAPSSCEPTPLWVTAVLQVPLWIGLVGSAVVVSRRFGTGDLRRDYGLRTGRGDWLGFPIGVVTQLVFVPLVSLPVIWLLGKRSDELSEPARELTGRAQGFGVVLLALLVVLLAPVVEELFFRGLVLRSIQARYDDTLALLGSALLFGLAHFQLLQLPALVMFGLVAGYCAQRTGRLGMSIYAHAGFNAVTVFFLVLNR